MKSQEEVLKIINDYTTVKDELEELIYTVYHNACKYKFAEGHIDEFEFSYGGESDENGKVICKWSSSWGYGGYDSGTYSFPISLLFSDSELYYKTEREKLDKEKIKQEKKAKKAKEQAEHRQYLKLKEKFEK